MEKRCGVVNTLPVKALAWCALDHLKAVLDDVAVCRNVFWTQQSVVEREAMKMKRALDQQ